MSKVKVNIKSKKTAPQPELTMNELDLPYFDSIYHISDIHIRPLQRHEEFREVFNKLSERLTGVENAIAIITGDIFDSKSVFKPETFQICRELFKHITVHMPLIVIAGNHDMMENNLNRLDSITPVVDDIPNLHYLKYSGLYQTNNICFVVSSLYDKGFITHQDIIGSNYHDKDVDYIALYHGTLSGAKTDIGYEVEADEVDGELLEDHGSSRYRSVGDFDGFNAVLLGDIHKHQLMKSNPPIAYAGSLIQQNHGENIQDHGILVWSRHSNKWNCELESIQNDYGFVDIVCHDGEWINDDVDLPKNCYARLVIKNCTDTQIDVITTTLKHKVDNLSITKTQCVTDSLEEFEIPPDIKRKEDEIELIKEQAEINHYDAFKLVELHQEYQKELDTDSKSMCTAVWRPINIEFCNMFGYGNNAVNKMLFKRGTVSISAGNTCGKTSIVNIILFAIFGRTPLNPSASSYTFDIVNNKQTSGYVKILLNHGGTYYLIERSTKQKNTKSITSATLKKLSRYDFTCTIWESNLKAEKIKNCSELRKNNNDTFIKELFGDINDFSLSNLLNKESSLDLLSMTPTEQIKVLKKLFKLEIYDAYRELNKQKLTELEKNISDTRIKLKTLEPLIDESITQSEISLKSTEAEQKQSDVEECKKMLNDLREEYNTFTLTLQEYQNKIVNVETADLPDSKDEIETELSTIDNNLEDTGLSVQTLEYKIRELTNQKTEIREEIDAIDNLANLSDLETQLKDLEAKQAVLGVDDKDGLDLNDVNRKLGLLTSKHVELKNKIEQIVIPETNIEHETLDNLKTKLCPLSSDLNAVQSRLDEISDKILDQMDHNTTKLMEDKIVLAKTNVSKLEADNRVMDIRRAKDFDWQKHDIESLRKNLIEGLPHSRISVNMEQLHSYESSLETHNKQLKCLVSGRSFTEIITELEQIQTHDTCTVNINLVKDIIVYLKDGDRIRELEKNSALLQTRVEKLHEHCDINTKIDNNKEIESYIAQITYHENLNQINSLKHEIEEDEKLLKRYVLTEEYHRLCVEEEKHYNNQDVQGMIDHFLAVEHLETLNNELQTVDHDLCYTQTMEQYLTIESEITTVQSEIDMHGKINLLRKKISKIGEQISETSTQLTDQARYERLQYLMDMKNRLETVESNDELRECIDDMRNDINDIKTDITKQSHLLDEKSHNASQIREELSLLQYKFNEQASIKLKLEETEKYLIELEKWIIPYTEYNSIMGNKGVTSKLLFNKIKSIEHYINTVIQQFTKYRVHILYDDKKQTISMITENKADNQYLSTTRLSGYEKLMLQIAFKRALNKFSYNSKSSLIIIDEALDCIDQDNFLTKLPDAMNLITQDYSNCLAISQRDIAHISDHIIRIKREDGSSIVVQ
jgi:DNA repair exonuclease SbcCD ATPase subunit/DNA repair exonuclease SbcCD nuclease subunit